MKNLLSSCTAALVLVLAASCNSDGDAVGDLINAACPEKIVVDGAAYAGAPDDPFFFADVAIHGDCLEMTVRYGGGCGDVVFKLLDAGEIMESYPVQRRIRLSLQDEDPCEALLTRQLSFDLTPVRLEEYDVVKLNLGGWGEQLTYAY